MMQLAVLPLALALSAAAPVSEAPVEQASVQTAQDGGAAATAGEGPGFMEKYLPFTFADNLEPETDENFLMLYVSGCFTTCLFANIWLPMVLIGNPGDFLIDQLIGTIVHYVPLICVPLAPIILAANALYLMPVQTVNTFDRNLKAAKRDGSWKGKGASNTVLPPNEQGLAMLEPAMAF